MSRRRNRALPVAIAALSVLVHCGTVRGVVVTPPHLPLPRITHLKFNAVNDPPYLG